MLQYKIFTYSFSQYFNASNIFIWLEYNYFCNKQKEVFFIKQ